MLNGLTYCIPRFQRDYSWGEDEWDDLWQDILGTIALGDEPAHYMGYLVLQSTDDKTFNVIDGQQRLTTLSIIVLAALKSLQRLIDDGKEPDRTRQRLGQLRQTYIGYLDPVTLVSRSKLTLNRNNDHYYQTYLAPLAEHMPQRRIRASEHTLYTAFEWFDRRVRDYAKANTSADAGMTIARLIESMSDKLFFTTPDHRPLPVKHPKASEPVLPEHQGKHKRVQAGSTATLFSKRQFPSPTDLKYNATP